MPYKKKKKKRRNQDLTPRQQLFLRNREHLQDRWPKKEIDWDRFGNIDTENDFRHWINSVVEQKVLKTEPIDSHKLQQLRDFNKMLAEENRKLGLGGMIENETLKRIPPMVSYEKMPAEQGRYTPRNVGGDIQVMGLGQQNPEEARIRMMWRNWNRKGRQGPEPTRPNWNR